MMFYSDIKFLDIFNHQKLENEALPLTHVELRHRHTTQYQE